MIFFRVENKHFLVNSFDNNSVSLVTSFSLALWADTKGDFNTRGKRSLLGGGHGGKRKEKRKGVSKVEKKKFQINMRWRRKK